MNNILWLGIPWLLNRFGYSKTKFFAVVAAGAAVYAAFAGFGGVSTALIAWAGAGAVFGLREAWGRIQPYIPILDKLLETYTGYADLDKVAAELDKFLAEVK